MTGQVNEASQSKKDITDKNKQLQEQLKMIKNQNEDLANRKVELTQELKKAKDDLSTLIEKGE